MSEFTTPNGFADAVHVNEDGSTRPMSSREIIAAVMEDKVIMRLDEDGFLWADDGGVLTRVIDVEVEEVEVNTLGGGATNDDYLWMIDDKGKYRSWEDDSELDYRADFKYPFQKGYTPSVSHLASGPGSWL